MDLYTPHRTDSELIEKLVEFIAGLGYKLELQEVMTRAQFYQVARRLRSEVKDRCTRVVILRHIKEMEKPLSWRESSSLGFLELAHTIKNGLNIDLM